MQSAIESGELAAGTRLPPERPLAEALAVSRTTVVLAYGGFASRAWSRAAKAAGRGSRAAPRSRARAPRDERSRSFLVDSLARAASDEPADTIGFMGACLPGSGLALDEEWRAAQADVAEIACGTGYSPQGWPPLRRAIAAHFEARGVPTTPDEILVTNGAQQAIDLVGRLLVGRGEAVVLEDPTYLGAIDAFSLAGARLLPVPVGPAGADIAALRRITQQATPALVYLVPSFHNPTGSVMPEGARREVAALAESERRRGPGGREPGRADVRRGAAAAHRRLRAAGARLHGGLLEQALLGRPARRLGARPAAARHAADAASRWRPT